MSQDRQQNPERPEAPDHREDSEDDGPCWPTGLLQANKGQDREVHEERTATRPTRPRTRDILPPDQQPSPSTNAQQTQDEMPSLQQALHQHQVASQQESMPTNAPKQYRTATVSIRL